MTDIELLEEAKRKYPKGTRFISVAAAHNDFTVNDENKFKIHESSSEYGNVIWNNGYGWIYSSVKGWAKITSSPIPIIPEFQIF